MSTDKSVRSITVTSPCLADWDQMTGNDQIRFCEHCNLKVHNISELSYSQAARLIARSQGGLCVRYYRDSQGAALTKQTSRKLHQIGRRASRIAAGAFSATLSLATAAAQTSENFQSNSAYSSQAQPDKPVFASTLVGTIKDPNGAVIAGATISILNRETNVSLYSSTGDDGTFRFDALAAGVYEIQVTAPGFATSEDNAIFVQATGETRVDRSLSIASLESEVTIQSETVATSGVMAYVAPEDPMIKAAQEDNLEQVQELLPGMNVNLRDKRSGTTALEHAVKNGNRQMVQLLLAAGADVNTRDQGGQTVLMMVNDDATTDLVWDLLNAGANVNEKDKEGNTPLIEAAGVNNIEVLRTLLDAGADITARNDEGETPLMMAASAGLVNNVRALLLAGSDLNQRNGEDKSALSQAIENGHHAVIRLLRAQGAMELVAQEKQEN